MSDAKIAIIHSAFLDISTASNRPLPSIPGVDEIQCMLRYPQRVAALRESLLNEQQAHAIAWGAIDKILEDPDCKNFSPVLLGMRQKIKIKHDKILGGITMLDALCGGRNPADEMQSVHHDGVSRE